MRYINLINISCTKLRFCCSCRQSKLF